MDVHPLSTPGLRVLIFDRACAAREHATEQIAAQVAGGAGGGRVVLGLATGRTQVGVYRRLVERHRRGLSFRDAETFNLDEFWPIAIDHPASFHRYMHQHLFDHVDLPRGRRHVPRGDVPEEGLAEHCREYEAHIQAAGGIDLQLLGIGRNGHVGFNEPGSERESRTRRVRLEDSTRRANAAAFGDAARVPEHAITLGLATILEARRLLVLAFGADKAASVAAALEGPVGTQVPASLLREHPDCQVLLDRDAAAELRGAYPRAAAR